MRAMTITLLSSLILLGCHGKATVEQPELTSTLSHEIDFERKRPLNPMSIF